MTDRDKRIKKIKNARIKNKLDFEDKGFKITYTDDPVIANIDGKEITNSGLLKLLHHNKS